MTIKQYTGLGLTRPDMENTSPLLSQQAISVVSKTSGKHTIMYAEITPKIAKYLSQYTLHHIFEYTWIEEAKACVD
ncbi:uncharacterized protein [Miscanthus floridulus]|uniref:uncharacterized protein isoform X4 n=1 Tax=Miscanthus floridulus TaxID=154761 RepID=UPI00345862A6